jgi:dTDP-4-amino-4,6-dideoxygalactose transaminase
MLNTNFAPWPSFNKEEIDAVVNVLSSNQVNYWTGNQCKDFEMEFARFVNVKYSLSLANGTLALELALKGLDINLGDEVIITSRTFIASVSSIVNIGAIPVFTDIDIDSQNIDPKSIRNKITSKTKAIMCVHLAGWPCEMDEIIDISNEFDLFIIEDCSQAHGAKYKNRSVGSIGDIGCWSFCQDKIMTTGGEGGMITTNSESLWRKMWAYKDHGKSFDAVFKRKHPKGFQWLHESFGSNYRMTEIQAAIGRVQINKMPKWHKNRLKNANMIWASCRECKGLYVPDIPSYIEHAAYKCYVFLKINKLKKDWNRDRIIEEINKLGVPCMYGSCSEVYLEKAFKHTHFRPKRRLSNAKKLGDTSLMFLVHPTLTENDIKLTCDGIKSIMELATR